MFDNENLRTYYQRYFQALNNPKLVFFYQVVLNEAAEIHEAMSSTFKKSGVPVINYPFKSRLV